MCQWLLWYNVGIGVDSSGDISGRGGTTGDDCSGCGGREDIGVDVD